MYKKNGRKGISVFISHILAIAILFVIFIAVSVSMFDYYQGLREKVQESQAEILCWRVADNMIKLYTSYKTSDYEPEEGGNDTLSEIYLNIPEKISGSNYVLSLERHMEFWVDCIMENETQSQNERPYTLVKVETENPRNTYSYPVYNLALDNVSGSVEKTTRVKLYYLREKQDGELQDYIIMERFS